jgi:hypothetical protein
MNSVGLTPQPYLLLHGRYDIPNKIFWQQNNESNVTQGFSLDEEALI